MATYVYDDFRVVMSPRADGRFDVRAADMDGTEVRGEFTVPFTPADLGAVLQGLARGHDAGTREVAPVDDGAPEDDAQRLGMLLADGLFAGDVGAAYERCRVDSEHRGRGLRLVLSLGDAPSLLDLPWELLYRRPRFIASQRRTPVVRHLDGGPSGVAPAIDGTVRILGLIADATDLPRLDVGDERQRVERAVAKMVDSGRVELTWLDPATPRALREALRDGSFHILHYVGHSSFTAAGEGAIYLPGEEGTAVAVDSEMLAMLLGDQQQLRLVVLNSCQGARTTVSDPYAGVATTLVHLGVPAVVAMQFAITDRAARVFAEELYTSLIGRQFPIDAALAEARKAVFVEIDQIEWATPVLFLRDPDVQLFDFAVPAADLPPPPPPVLPVTALADTSPDTSPDGRAGAAPDPTAGPIPGPIPVPAPAPAAAATSDPPRRRSKTVRLILVGAAVLLALIAATVVVIALTDDDAAAPTTTLAGSPRARSGYLVAQVQEADGETHLYNFLPGSAELGKATDRAGVTDIQPAIERTTNRVAFTRAEPGVDGSQLKYVVPKEAGNPDDGGKQVATLVPHSAGDVDHFPVWGDDASLYYLRADGCAPGAGCDEALRFATFDVASDGAFLDALTVADEEEISNGFQDVSAMAVNPSDASQVSISDSDGLWLVRGDGTSSLLDPGVRPAMLAFTPDGALLVAITVTESAFQQIDVYDARVPRKLATGGFASSAATVRSIVAGDVDQQLVMLADAPGTAAEVLTVQVGTDASLTVLGESLQIPRVLREGTPQAIAF